jgi:hypothetical protein
MEGGPQRRRHIGTRHNEAGVLPPLRLGATGGEEGASIGRQGGGGVRARSRGRSCCQGRSRHGGRRAGVAAGGKAGEVGASQGGAK